MLRKIVEGMPDSRVVMVPHGPWLAALNAAVVPEQADRARMLADLKLGATRTIGVPEVGILAGNVRAVLDMVPAAAAPSAIVETATP